MLPLVSEEWITAILPIKAYAEDRFVFMATANGTVKKTPLEQFSRPRTSGLIALELEPGNTLVGVALTDGHCDVLLSASSGKVVRFKESDVRAMGRTARGVRGIRLTGRHVVISLIIPQTGGYVLSASERGYGKRTHIDEFPVKGRGTQGVIGIQTTDRNGDVIGAVQVFDADEIMLISNLGTLVRTAADEVSQLSRNTQGVRLINLRDDEHLVGLQRIVETEEARVVGADDDVDAAPVDDAQVGGQVDEGQVDEGPVDEGQEDDNADADD
jgi:DNA gyrase subunit A